MNYLVIDLEMCKVSKKKCNINYKHRQEIIQVGAVLLDRDYQEIARLSQYVQPEYGLVDRHIEKLTGIKDSQLRNAPKLSEVLSSLLDWIGDQEYRVMAWSRNDYDQLMKEIRSKGIWEIRIFNFMNGNRWTDYQKVFGRRFEFSRAVGLDEALIYSRVAAEGRFHDGLFDAVNTAKLIAKLETDKEFQFKNLEKQFHEPVEHLTFSLRDLFVDIGQLELA